MGLGGGSMGGGAGGGSMGGGAGDGSMGGGAGGWGCRGEGGVGAWAVGEWGGAGWWEHGGGDVGLGCCDTLKLWKLMKVVERDALLVEPTNQHQAFYIIRDLHKRDALLVEHYSRLCSA